METVERPRISTRDSNDGSVENFNKHLMPRPAEWVGISLDKKFTPPQYLLNAKDAVRAMLAAAPAAPLKNAAAPVVVAPETSAAPAKPAVLPAALMTPRPLFMSGFARPNSVAV